MERGDAADAVIDRAVREIMSAEPRPGFRQRVFARLESRPAPSVWTRFGVAALAAAGIITFVVLSRPVDRTPERPAIVAQRPPVTSLPPPTAAPRVPDRPAPRASKAPPRRIESEPPRSEERIVRAASLPPDSPDREDPPAAESIDRLLPLDPITVAPLAAPSVIVRPLPAIERIAISPLLPPSPPK